nr:hypothetical protein [Sphingomonas sp. T1]
MNEITRDRMLDERVADLAARAGDDVEDARRETCFLEHLSEEQPAYDRRIRDGFEHDRLADRNCGGDRAGGELEGEVPRRDHADDADRLAIDAAFPARCIVGQDAPLDHIGQTAGFEHDAIDGFPF